MTSSFSRERRSLRASSKSTSAKTRRDSRRAFFETLEDRSLMATQVFTRVPEANNYTLVYELPIGSVNNFTNGVPYTVDNTAQVTQPFDRIAYYLELDSPSTGPQWVYASMDAFTTNVNKIGVPNVTSGEFYQQKVSNMNVFSNNKVMTMNGTGIQTGNIEFWPSNYSQTNSILIPNANDTTTNGFDFGDGGAGLGNGHGSMQIHNYDIDGTGPGTTGETLMAFNNWNTGTAGAAALGIGNDPNMPNRGTNWNPDWTFASNVNNYTVKNMAILVRQVDNFLPPEVYNNAPELKTYDLVYQKNLPTAATYNTSGVNYDFDNSALIANGSFDRVAYYLKLDNQFVEVSFNSAGFATQANKIGIPNAASGEVYQQNVANMNVTSNVAGVVNGTGITTGNVEFWPSNYSQNNAAGVPGASSAGDNTGYDFGDQNSGGNGYGSMQIHNYGAGQTIFAYNNWNSGTSDLGIGNRGVAANANDWTFSSSAGNYTTRTLYAFVHRTTQTPIPSLTAPAAPAALVAAAPELADYKLALQKVLPTAANFSTGAITYDVNNTALIPDGSYDRVAYYLELDGKFVEVSFNADGFSDRASRLGIPNVASGENYQQYVQNMNVASNVAGVATGNGMSTGVVEFWANNYQANRTGQNTGLPAALGVPNSSDTAYDFGDRQSTGGFYGSMQVHNYDIDGTGPGTAGQTLFAYNNWNSGGVSDLGIGNDPNTGRGQYNPDYTFSANNGFGADKYTSRNLYVLVRPREAGNSTNDNIVLKKVNGLIQYEVNGTGPIVVSSTAPLLLNGLDGNDTLTVDYSGGNPIPTGGVTFNGNDPTTGPGDKIVLTGGSATNIAYTFLNKSDGAINIDGSIINYTGLEPVIDNMPATNRSFTYTGGAETITMTDSGGADGMSTLASTLGESVTFTNPSGSLSIDAGTGDDIVNINGIDAGLGVPVTITGGANNDAVNLNTAFTFNALSVTAETIAQTAAINVTNATTIDATGGTATLTQANDFIGAVTVTGGNSVSLTDANALVIATATTATNLTLSAPGNITQTGAISGPGNLTKQGTGTLTLSQTNTYGTLFVQAGIAKPSTPAGIPGPVVVTSGGTYDVNAQNMNSAGKTVTIVGVGASGQLGALVNTAGGTEASIQNLILTGNASMGSSGTKLNVFGTIDGGGAGNVLTMTGGSEKNIRTLNSVSNLGRIIASAGLTRFEGDQTTWTGTMQINAGATVDTYIAPGTRTMAAGLDFQGGTLTTGSGSSVWTGAFTLTNPSIVNVGAGNTITLSANGTGAQELSKTNTGTLILSGSGSTFTAPITVQAGKLEAQNAAALGATGGATNVWIGAEVDLNFGGGSIAEPFNPAGSGTNGFGAVQTVNTGTTTLTGPINLAGNATLGSSVAATTLVVQGQVDLRGGEMSFGGPGPVNVTGNVVDSYGTSVFNRSAGFPDATGLSLVQNTAIAAPRLRLTTNAGSLFGNAWTTAKQHVGAGFSTNFSLGFDGPLVGGNGADGIAFSIQNTPEGNARQNGGESGPGTRALTIGINSYNANSATASLINVISNGATLFTYTTTYDVSSRTNVPLQINYVPGDLDVMFDINGDGTLQANETIVANLNVNLNQAQAVDNNGDAWVGFSGRTGGVAEFHYVNNWTFTSGGNGNVTKIGAGTANISGNNTYTGITSVNAGTLQVNATTALGTTAGTTRVAPGGVLALNIGSGTLTEPLVVGGNGTGSGAIVNVAGSPTLSGNVVVGSLGTIGNPVGGTTVTVSGPIDLQDSTLSTSGAGNVVLSGNITDSATAISTPVNFATFPDAAGLNIFGTSASVTGGKLQLTSNGGSQLGSAWLQNKVHVGGGFTTDFTLGFDGPLTTVGADGMAFSLQNTAEGANRLASGAAENGPGANAFTLGINSYNAASTTTSVLSLISNGTTLATVNTGYDLSADTNVPFRIIYRPGSIDVLFDFNNDNVLGANEYAFRNFPVDLATSLALDGGGNAYAGFMARTGGDAEFHKVVSWSLSTGGHSAGVTQNGPGITTLSGNNTYIGTTNVTGGTLVAGSLAALGTTAGGTSVTNNGVLQLQAGGGTIAEPLTLSGNGTGSGAVVNSTSSHTLSGGITLASPATIGNLSAGTLLTLSGPASLAGRDLTFSGPGDITESSNLSDGTLASINQSAGFAVGDMNIFGATAGLVGTSLRLTNNTNSQTGQAWKQAKQYVGDGFSTDFVVNFSSPAGGGADGVGFTIQNRALGASENTGGEAGPGTQSLTVTLNSYGANVAGDNSRISLYQNGVLTHTAPYPGFDFSGAGNLLTRVVYTPGDLDVYFDLDRNGSINPATELVFNSVSVNLGAAGMQDAFGYAWVGFSARTGGANENHDVVSWTFTNGTAPSNLTKLGSGNLTLSGANTYTGTTSVVGGTLTAGSAGALGGTAGNTVVTSGAVLQINANANIPEPIVISGTGIGAGAIVNTTTSNTLSGAISIPLAATIGNSTAGTTLTLSGPVNAGGNVLTLAGAGNVNVSGAISDGTALTSIDHSAGFTVPDLNTFGASAGYVGGALRLTNNTNSQSGQAWIPTKQNVAEGFTTDFVVNFSGPNNGGADGLAFVVQNRPLGASENTGGEAGPGTQALAVSLNSWNGGTPNSIIQLYQNAALTNTSAPVGFDFSGAGSLLTRVTYTPGDLDVYFDLDRNGSINPATELVLNSINVNLGTIGAQDANGLAWVGFTARTGGANENHDVFSWSFTSGAGSAAVVKTGTGTATLGGTNTYTGTTTVNQGTLLVTGSLANGPANPDVIVNSTGTLGGTGTVSGQVQVASGGKIAPGTSPGVLATGDVTFASGSSFDVELNNTTVGSGYDQLNVAGVVTLGNATLNLSGTFAPNVSVFDTFTIINNDGSDAVVGTFNGLPQGAAIPFGGGTLYISYTGGDGNDVVLSSQLAGSAGADTVVLRRLDAANNEYSLNGGAFISVTNTLPFGFNGLGGNDLLLVDTTNGDPIPLGNVGVSNLEFVRVEKTQGAAMDSATITPTGVTVAGYGTITFGGTTNVDVVNFSSVIVNTAAANDSLTLTNGSTSTNGGALPGGPIVYSIAAVPEIQVSGLGVIAGVRNVGTLTVDTVNGGGNGNDTVTVTSANNAHGVGNLTITTGTGTDAIVFNGAAVVSGTVTLSSGGNISTGGTANDVTAAALVATAVTGIDLDTTVATATITNSGAGNVTLDNVGALNLLGVSVASGNAAVNATGALTDAVSAVLSVGGLASVSGASITLGETATDSLNFNTTTFNSAGAVVISENSSLDLVGVNTAGSADLDSTAAISDGGATSVTVTGLLDVNGTSVTLGGGILNAGTTTFNSAGPVVISEDSSLDITGVNLAASVDLDSTAGISDAGATSVNVTGLVDVAGTSIALGGGVFNAGTLKFASSGAVTIAEDSTMDLVGVSTGGAITLSTVDTAGVENISLPAAASLSGSSVALDAGDDAILAGSITSTSDVNIKVDFGTADAAGGAATITGTITTPAANATFIDGNVQNDTINLQPSTTTEYRVFGDAPATSPGDTLKMTVTGLNATLSAPGSTGIYTGQGSGDWTFGAGQRPVRFGAIETLDITGSYHLAYNNDVTKSANLVVLLNGGGLEIHDGTAGGPLLLGPVFGTLLSLTVNGNNDVGSTEQVTIDDVGGLPVFTSTPVLSPDNATVAGLPGMYFQGNNGTNILAFNLTNANTTQIVGLGDGTTGAPDANAEVATTSAGGSLNVYGSSLTSVQRTGSGASPGALTVQAEGGNDTINVTGSGTATTIAATNYVPFTFSAINNYSAENILGNDGNDTLTLTSLGGGTSNVAPVTLSGGNGNDTINVGNTSLAAIGAAVTVSGGANNDTLNVTNSGSATANTNVVVKEDAIDNLTGRNAANDVVYGTVETLNVFTSSVNDTITVALDGSAASSVVTATINGSGGNDQFVFTSATTPSLDFLNLQGGSGNDVFGTPPAGPVGSAPVGGEFVPTTGVRIVVSGESSTSTSGPNPSADNDQLNLNISSFNTAEIVDTGSGQVLSLGSMPAHDPFYFNGVEDLNLYDNNKLTNTEIGDLLLRSTNDNVNDNILFYKGYTSPNDVLIRFNNQLASTTPFLPTTRLVAYGRGGSDRIELNYTIGKLKAVFYGEDGNDYLTGSLSSDLLVGGAGADQLIGGDASDVLWGDQEGLTWAQRSGDNSLASTDGNDTLEGDAGDDFMFGGGGNDQLTGMTGNDYLHGGYGADNLVGADGNDLLRGGDGNDQLTGDKGNDILLAGLGDDFLYGGADRDFAFSGAGSDRNYETNDTGEDVNITENQSLELDAANPSYDAANSATFFSPNDTTLLALMTTWSAATPFATRAAAAQSTLLSGSSSDGSLDYLVGNTLTLDYSIVAATTIYSNSSGDTIDTVS